MASQFPVPFAGPRQLGRLDPFDDITQEFSRLFGSFFPGAGSLLGLPARTADAAALPRLDVQEDDEGIRVCAELPGVNTDDVEVRVESDMLVISGEKKAQQGTSIRNFHVMERSFGQFKRAIALPFTPDPQTVDASFDLGVLTVRIPRQLQRETSRRIEVRQAGGSSPQTYLDDGQRMPAGPDSEPRVGDEPARG
jgi:HSP20 family protein